MVDRVRVISRGPVVAIEGAQQSERQVLSPHIGDYSQVMQFNRILFPDTGVKRQLNCICSLHFKSRSQ